MGASKWGQRLHNSAFLAYLLRLPLNSRPHAVMHPLPRSRHRVWTPRTATLLLSAAAGARSPPRAPTAARRTGRHDCPPQPQFSWPAETAGGKFRAVIARYFRTSPNKTLLKYSSGINNYGQLCESRAAIRFRSGAPPRKRRSGPHRGPRRARAGQDGCDVPGASHTVMSCLRNPTLATSAMWNRWPTAPPARPGASSPRMRTTPTSAASSCPCSVLDPRNSMRR